MGGSKTRVKVAVERVPIRRARIARYAKTPPQPPPGPWRLGSDSFPPHAADMLQALPASTSCGKLAESLACRGAGSCESPAVAAGRPQRRGGILYANTTLHDRRCFASIYRP